MTRRDIAVTAGLSTTRHLAPVPYRTACNTHTARTQKTEVNPVVNKSNPTRRHPRPCLRSFPDERRRRLGERHHHRSTVPHLLHPMLGWQRLQRHRSDGARRPVRGRLLLQAWRIGFHAALRGRGGTVHLRGVSSGPLLPNRHLQS